MGNQTSIETIKIVNYKKNGKGFLIINVTDFDTKKHTKWKDRKINKVPIENQKSETKEFNEKILKRGPGRPKKIKDGD